jgi:type II secretory pathway component GspD/PulD (secretin)
MYANSYHPVPHDGLRSKVNSLHRPGQKLALLFLALGLSACASTTQFDSSSQQVKKEHAAMVNQYLSEVKLATDTITDMERFQRGVDYEVLRQDADHGDLTINAAGTLAQLLSQVASKQNFAVVYAEGVDRNKQAIATVANSSPVHAIRRIAASAGYVAIIDQRSRSVTVAETATYTFRIPSDVMKQLEAQFTVGGSATGGSSGGAGSGGPPGMGGGSPTSGGSGAVGANFTARGNLGANGDQLREYLTRYAGTNAEVSIARDFGLVTVRGSGVSLMRMREFLNDFSEAARRTVEVRAAMVEVTLKDEFEFGVSWERLLRNGTFGANLMGAANVTSPALSLTLTKTNTEAIVNMLQIRGLGRVLTEPRTHVKNWSTSILSDGRRLPFLGELTQSQNQTSTTTSGRIDYAVDGVTLSLGADIISERDVQLTLVPVLARVGEERRFQLGPNSSLTGFEQIAQQSLMQALLQSGQTVILGGLRSSSEQDRARGIPGLVKAAPSSTLNNNTHREVVLILTATILPSLKTDTLFSESL